MSAAAVGWAPAVPSVLPASAANRPRFTPQQVIYTENVVVPVPIVDESMPYNVIAISSTLLALFVGSMFGLFVQPGKHTRRGAP